ncbi:PLC-like phosphodiesterase [Moniliophthora roreri MCA 2997]|uniref:PLC-like phosphodiesterase n=1 Tax=Moniliophthora roreri (strain MCA 2997) TaxID=1381753 RepID=V2WBK5_MONRO|nr:PLC-like phosphodiesterase [Moniliophthora roreri MCA 2997]KAI3595895.1 PLC-like phosphodiesterase [Moniliophthora roreri]
MISFRQLLVVSLVVASVNALPFTSKRQAKPEKCNGRAELCDRKFSDVTFFGAHNSYAFSKNPLNVGRNQVVDVPTQLKLGARLLQAQSHMDGNILKFCHTNCDIFDGGSVEDYFRIVKTFLDENPDEVLTLILTNPEGLSVSDVRKPIFDKSGLTPFAFVPGTDALKASDWPTLGSMIQSGKRLVVFMDSNADVSKVDFILPEFKMVWETPFSVTDENFPCKVDRIDTTPLNTADHMYMINHSLNVNLIPDLPKPKLPFGLGDKIDDAIGEGVIVPDFVRADETNSVASITKHADGCAKLDGVGKKPTFVLLDWVDIGEGFDAANQLNGF